MWPAPAAGCISEGSFCCCAVGGWHGGNRALRWQYHQHQDMPEVVSTTKPKTMPIMSPTLLELVRVVDTGVGDGGRASLAARTNGINLAAEIAAAIEMVLDPKETTIVTLLPLDRFVARSVIMLRGMPVRIASASARASKVVFTPTTMSITVGAIVVLEGLAVVLGAAVVLGTAVVLGAASRLLQLERLLPYHTPNSSANPFGGTAEAEGSSPVNTVLMKFN